MTGSLRWRMSGGLLRGTRSYSRRTCGEYNRVKIVEMAHEWRPVARHSLMQQAHLGMAH